MSSYPPNLWLGHVPRDPTPDEILERSRKLLEATKMDAVLRAKMTVNSVKRVADGNGEITSEEISLNAVYGPDGSANKQWSQWTPCGSLTMTINNKGAFNRVLPGQFFFIDFVPCEKDSV